MKKDFITYEDVIEKIPILCGFTPEYSEMTGTLDWGHTNLDIFVMATPSFSKEGIVPFTMDHWSTAGRPTLIKNKEKTIQDLDLRPMKGKLKKQMEAYKKHLNEAFMLLSASGWKKEE